MEDSIDTMLFQLSHILGCVESLTRVVNSGYCGPTKLLRLFFNALCDSYAEVGIRTYDGHTRFWGIRFSGSKVDQCSCLFFETRQQIENIAVNRQSSLRQQRGRTYEGHFFLLTKRRNTLFSARSETTHDREDLLIVDQVFHVCEGRRCVSMHEAQFNFAIINAATAIDLGKICLQHVFHRLGQTR